MEMKVSELEFPQLVLSIRMIKSRSELVAVNAVRRHCFCHHKHKAICVPGFQLIISMKDLYPSQEQVIDYSLALQVMSSILAFIFRALMPVAGGGLAMEKGPSK